ncbi:SDR family NAD(P)-dependent oxidoreductase [uncultured Pseudomonas sp.]|jgi:NAD(P)-dependent dehydrogenase (short-subunit alcohol dehydrogenase family)|uniref:SDR family NAD(P)-dependent oxidoreductase n=1 Tax=Pseudomonas citronellolis TaxID=53408 RepID=UPI0027D9965D|nr:SDR family NAD(P)-dependent oxidoreductase [uncultured Pseudomonas sp.]
MANDPEEDAALSKLASYYNNKIAVVTGAGSGIGRAIAQHLGALGARVYCTDVDGAAAQRVAEGLPNAAGEALDVTDAAALAAFAERVYAREGRVDLLFNNAGVGHAGRVEDTELADWRWVFEVNLMGVVHGIHAFLPRMLAQPGRGHIVNTASGAGLIPMPRTAPYCASKHAVVGLSQSLAAELAGRNVDVTILCPGTIDTAIIRNTRMRGAGAEQRQSRAVEYYARRGVSPDRVAADVLTDISKGRLFCVTPRSEVGVGWLLQRLSPRLMQRIMRARMDKVEATD